MQEPNAAAWIIQKKSVHAQVLSVSTVRAAVPCLRLPERCRRHSLSISSPRAELDLLTEFMEICIAVYHCSCLLYALADPVRYRSTPVQSETFGLTIFKGF